MSETILKIGCLDLDLQGQENVFEFYFLLFNKYLNALDRFVKLVTLTLIFKVKLTLQVNLVMKVQIFL